MGNWGIDKIAPHIPRLQCTKLVAHQATLHHKYTYMCNHIHAYSDTRAHIYMYSHMCTKFSSPPSTSKSSPIVSEKVFFFLC